MWCPYFSWLSIHMTLNISVTRLTLIYISRPDLSPALSPCVTQPAGPFLIINGTKYLPLSLISPFPVIFF